MLMLTVTMSIYKSLFILTSMVVLMLVYGLMGVVLFGSVKFGDNLGRHANFHNAFRAIILLSRIVTGESFNPCHPLSRRYTLTSQFLFQVRTGTR